MPLLRVPCRVETTAPSRVAKRFPTLHPSQGTDPSARSPPAFHLSTHQTRSMAASTPSNHSLILLRLHVITFRPT
jgi:hypothetical protein